MTILAVSDGLADTMVASNEPSHASSDFKMQFTHAPNDVVLDRYTIQRGVGLGGFGEVYFAVSQAGKEVALKRVQRNLDVELRGVSHCLNLKHPNLVSLHDVCRDQDGQTWVVMEYVRGPNLREVLDEASASSGLSETEVLRWFRGIAAGVAHLHAAGLVHRDLKPGNLFDDGGIVKVGDYGLSKFISVSHRSGHTESVGTFHYMAPEIGRGQYGREIDIYALGVILYELLTGRTPFNGETPQEIVVRHMTDLPDLTRVPPKYRECISKCLEKDPLRRPVDVDEMLSLAGLSGAQVGEPPVVTVEATDASPKIRLESNEPQEPIARAVRNSFADLSRWWRSLERSPGSKAVMIVATIFILLINTHWLLPVASLVGIFYVPYYIIRHMVLQIGQGETYTQANHAASVTIDQQRTHAMPATPKPRPMTPAQIRAELRRQLGSRNITSRLAEWTTSGMTSMVVGSVLLLITSVVGMRSTELSALTLAPYGWMASVVWIGAFGLLSMGKVWESSEAEGITRRLAAASWGAGLGLIAYSLGQFLMIPMDGGLMRDVDATRLPVSFYHESGVPKAAAMMAHFAMLFGLLRAWKPVDPLRRVRLSLWSVAVAVVGEWIVHQFIPIPQPSGMLIAGGIVMMSQVSAPWVRSDSLPATIEAA
ncbi:MAG: serine/threonine-protein kinase [Planctomycetota bacterium]